MAKKAAVKKTAKKLTPLRKPFEKSSGEPVQPKGKVSAKLAKAAKMADAKK